MSKEKQIEEMIEALKKCSCVYTDCEQECSQCSNEELYDDALNHIARTLYEAGYRKQSEGEWIVARTERSWNNAEYPIERNCSVCGMRRNIETQEAWNFCPNCGAKMKGGAE